MIHNPETVPGTPRKENPECWPLVAGRHFAAMEDNRPKCEAGTEIRTDKHNF